MQTGPRSGVSASVRTGAPERINAIRQKIFEEFGINSVSLDAFRIQPGDPDRPAQNVEGVQKRGVGPVPFDRHVRRGETGPSGNPDFPVFRKDGFHPEPAERPDRHQEIGAAFDRRQNGDLAFAVQEGQRQRKPADELAADSARHGIGPGRQPAPNGHGFLRTVKPESPLPAEIGKDGQRPLHQGCGSGQSHFPPRQQGNRDQKPQRRPAGPAGQNPARRFGKIRPGNPYGVSAPVDLRAQSAQTVRRREKILRGRDAPDGADPAGQRRAEEIPVGKTLRSGRRDRSACRGRLQLNDHALPPMTPDTPALPSSRPRRVPGWS